MELDRGGVAVHYDVAGSGPAILLSHGFGASSHMFRPNAPALTSAGRPHTTRQRVRRSGDREPPAVNRDGSPSAAAPC